MNAHALHILSVYAFELGWILFGLIFIFRKRWPRDKTQKRDPASIVGIVIQSLSLLPVWMMARRSDTILPLGSWFQLLTPILVILISLISLWTLWSSVRVLGKQWSLQARVLEDHQLIREGPYRFVRHPIYTGMLGMIVVGALAWTHWIGFVVSLSLFTIGTIIRVRSEEKLLREQFGAAFEDYKRSVPAVLPLKL
jgi:protein-S-isoprenylcysteine O-methyltransferase Ste14